MTGTMIQISIPQTAITRDEVHYDAPMVAGTLEWLRWLAEQDAQLPLTVGQIMTFYQEHVRLGRYPSEVAEDLGLPSHPDW